MTAIFERLCIHDSEEILAAVERIESSQLQTAFVVDKDKRLVGLITNGDLRRHLLNGGAANSLVAECMNRNFRCAGPDATREDILKLLDLGLSVIPKVDAAGRLIDLITNSHNLASPEGPILTRARAPVRVSFSGGGSDLTYYFVDQPGAVLSTTVALYCHATLIPRADKKINIYSEDLGTHSQFPSLAHLLKSPTKNLLTAVVSVVKPTHGFDLYVRSDFPIGSGLGGSSAVTTAVIAAFNEMRFDHWTSYEIAELAFQAERLCFAVAGGWQDHYASAFGGFNLIELDGKKNLVHAIRLEKSILNELEECLILCNSMLAHDSGDLHALQRETFVREDKAQELMSMVTLCREMHRHLIRGELLEFGRSLDKGWRLKRGLSPAVSSTKIDDIYQQAVNAGAVGGKLLGAGAGGYFIFFVQPQYRRSVADKLRELGCTLTSFKFETEGVTSWRTKIL